MTTLPLSRIDETMEELADRGQRILRAQSLLAEAKQLVFDDATHQEFDKLPINLSKDDIKGILETVFDAEWKKEKQALEFAFAQDEARLRAATVLEARTILAMEKEQAIDYIRSQVQGVFSDQYTTMLTMGSQFSMPRVAALDVAVAMILSPETPAIQRAIAKNALAIELEQLTKQMSPPDIFSLELSLTNAFENGFLPFKQKGSVSIDDLINYIVASGQN